MRSPTPQSLLTDPQGRPYFLWDMDVSMDEFRRLIRDPDPAVRAYFMAKLMRQAKPDDVFLFVTLGQIVDNWDRIVRHLGQKRSFWSWLLERWSDPELAEEHVTL